MQKRFCNMFNLFEVVLFIYAFTQVGVNSFTLNAEERMCVHSLKLNQSAIETWNLEPLLPEDNEDIIKYMSCYWKKLGYQEKNGELNYLKIGEVVHGDLKNRFRADCLHIAVYVVDTCRNNVNPADSDGLKAIKMWNCLNIYAENLF